ncbi:MAG: VRR-NUC domain-containing protein [Chitinispirillales bacterium]|jgi:hypothetical protein|nr:VRR-NUC domain-containing protein [Chitinispirillales bacterium]
MTNKSKIPVPSESKEQIALFYWARLNVSSIPELGLLFSIPNGGYRTPSTAARMKAEGERAGVPDCFLPIPRGRYSGLWIELKRLRGSKIDPLQKWWAERLSAQGYAHVFAYGWEEAVKAIETYLSGQF